MLATVIEHKVLGDSRATKDNEIAKWENIPCLRVESK